MNTRILRGWLESRFPMSAETRLIATDTISRTSAVVERTPQEKSVSPGFPADAHQLWGPSLAAAVVFSLLAISTCAS